MINNLININKKSFLALILISILMLSVMSPVILAADIDEHVYTETEQKYEQENQINGEVIDFSDGKEVHAATFSGNGSIPGSYSMIKEGNNYTITLENVTAKKIILPPDAADGANGKNALSKDDKGKIAERKTHITIKLIGTNDITGYGLTGYYVKGVTIKGNGSLNVKTHLEEKSGNYYIVPGIFVETDEIDDKVETTNTGLVFDGVKVTVTNPYYWGVICNGDIELKNGAKLNVNSYNGIKKRAEAGGISTDKLFVGEDCSLTAYGKVLIFKKEQQVEQEKAREKAKYKNDHENPTITGKTSDGKEIVADQIYCEQPTITVKDDQKIAKIKVNEETITQFKEGSNDKEKSFVVPSYLDRVKTVVATDMNDNETTFTFKSNSGHITVKGKEFEYQAPTCTDAGYRKVEYKCLVCGVFVTTDTEVIPALGHSYGDWTYYNETQEKRNCTRCSHFETKDSTEKIANTKVYLSASNYVYDGTKKEPTVIVKDDNETLVNGEDYTVKYSNNVKAGTATVAITGENHYTGTITTNFKIEKKDNSITASNITANYSKKAQNIKIGAKQTGDAKLTYSSNNKSITVNSSGVVTVKAGYVGKATITITASDTANYNKATKNITVTINKVNNKITASNFTKKYSKKAQSFSIGAKQVGNAKLTYSSNNKNVKVNSAGKVTIAKGFIGKATITITANATQGYNKATKKITVVVNPPTVKISKLSNIASRKMTIKWNKNTAVTGYQIQYSTDKNFKKGVKTTTVKKNNTVSKLIVNLVKNKTYYVRIRSYKTVSKVNYYSSWSVKNIKIKK